MIASIEYIDMDGSIIATRDGIIYKAIYLDKRELRSIYESLRAYYGDCEKSGKTGREN